MAAFCDDDESLGSVRGKFLDQLQEVSLYQLQSSVIRPENNYYYFYTVNWELKQGTGHGLFQSITLVLERKN
jgi:hypothetical protein